MAVKYAIDPVFKHYCRTCVRATWHGVREGSAACSICGRLTHGAEIVATYATDEYENPPQVLLPRHNLPQYDGLQEYGDD